jgi:hypothetical protein
LLAGSLSLTGANATPDSGTIGVGQIELRNVTQWQAAPAIGAWVPVFPGADAESLVEFSRGESRITAYTATSLRQSQGRELIGHDSLVEGNEPGRLARSPRLIAAAVPSIETIEAEGAAPAGQGSSLGPTHQLAHFTNGLKARLWYGLSSLCPNRSRSSWRFAPNAARTANRRDSR